ncbi:MAG: hypothetical protein Q4B88_00900 [Moraxella sp.]|nr:hypothetical protein [Moraxella sp.]
MNQMRRFVDVIFVQPKKKYYVILHQGNFWRLPRLNLTISSWEAKTPYLGSLEDVYVSKNQVIDCEKLAAILDTQPLPEELHGLSAHRFLDWWSMHDYEWLAKKSTKANSVKTANTPQNTEKSSEVATPNLQRTTPLASPNPPTHQAVTPAAAPAAMTPNPVIPSSAVANPASPSTKTDTQPTTKVPTKNPETQGFDIFDSLLQELNEEVQHLHQKH